MHTPRDTTKRRTNCGAALNGSVCLTAAGEGYGERIAAKSLDSGAPRNAISFIKKHNGSTVREYSAVICQFGESAVKLIGKINFNLN